MADYEEGALADYNGKVLQFKNGNWEEQGETLAPGSTRPQDTLGGLGQQALTGLTHDFASPILGAGGDVQNLGRALFSRPPTTAEKATALPTSEQVSKSFEGMVPNVEPKTELEKQARFGAPALATAALSPEMAAVRGAGQVLPALAKSAVRNVAAPVAAQSGVAALGGGPIAQGIAGAAAPSFTGRVVSPRATTPEQAALSKGVEAGGLRLSPKEFQGKSSDPRLDQYNKGILNKAFGDWNDSKVPGVVPLPSDSTRVGPFPYSQGNNLDVIHSNIGKEFNKATASSPGLDFAAVKPQLQAQVDSYRLNTPQDPGGADELQKSVNDLESGLIPTNGILQGRAYQNTRSDLGKNSVSAAPGMKQAYGEMKNILDNAFERTIPNANDRGLFTTARQHHKYAVALDDEVRGANPAAASGQVTPEGVLRKAANWGDYHKDPVVEFSKGALLRPTTPLKDKTQLLATHAAQLALPLSVGAEAYNFAPEKSDPATKAAYSLGGAGASVAAAKMIDLLSGGARRAMSHGPIASLTKNQMFPQPVQSSPLNAVPMTTYMTQALSKSAKGKPDNSQ